MFGLNWRKPRQDQLAKAAVPQGLLGSLSNMPGIDRQEIQNLRMRLDAIEQHLGIRTFPVPPSYKVVEVLKGAVGSYPGVGSATTSAHA